MTNYNGYEGSRDISYTGKERDAAGLYYLFRPIGIRKKSRLGAEKHIVVVFLGLIGFYSCINFEGVIESHYG